MSSSSLLRPHPFSDPVLNRLAALARRAEHSRSFFAVPLGPDAHGLYLPRFVAFGPNSTDGDFRISVLAGFHADDDAASLAAFELLEDAIAAPHTIGGVVLDIVPVVNRGTGDLWSAPWLASARPELALLEREYRRLVPHAVVQIAGGNSRVPQGAVRGESLVHWLDHAAPSLFAASWNEPFARSPGAQTIDEIVPDLPFRPLELRLRLGRDGADNAAALRAIVQRIRVLLAHAQHL